MDERTMNEEESYEDVEYWADIVCNLMNTIARNEKVTTEEAVEIIKVGALCKIASAFVAKYELRRTRTALNLDIKKEEY